MRHNAREYAPWIEDETLPGIDEESCPVCGGWKKVGLDHDCVHEKELLSARMKKYYNTIFADDFRE